MINKLDHGCVRPFRELNAASGSGELRVADASGQAEGGRGEASTEIEDALFAEENEADEMTCEPCEERVPKTLFDPLLPTPKEVAAHNLTHCPYRSWCKICVESRGREDAHKSRKGEDPSEGGLPEIAMDYD